MRNHPSLFVFVVVEAGALITKLICLHCRAIVDFDTEPLMMSSVGEEKQEEGSRRGRRESEKNIRMSYATTLTSPERLYQ